MTQLKQSRYSAYL